MQLIKIFERCYRQIRSYLQPSHYRSASKARSSALAPPSGQQICLFDFNSIKIDNDMGRYLHHLITEFEECGYYIAFTNNYRFLATIDSKAFKKLIFKRPFSIIELNKPPKHCKLLVTDSEKKLVHSFDKTIQIDYRQMRVLAAHRNAFELPFFVHPEIHDSQQVTTLHKSFPELNQPRSLRILFAGNAKARKYDSPVLAKTYKVMSRVKILNSAKRTLSDKQLRMPQSTASIIPSEYSNTLTIATTQSSPIPSQEWINTIGKSDFYLACPGVGMPLCHNLIEALAAGSIPILQYPQYLDPPLENGKNCLVFNDESELDTVLQKALNMERDNIRLLQLNIASYYQNHLEPGTFTQKLINSQSAASSLYLNAYHVPKGIPQPPID